MILTSHQPNFLPYMGVIYKAYKSDAIVLSDDVCYSKKGMHNWNVIRTKNGSQKITIPVNAHHDTKLCDVMISEPRNTLPKIVRTLEETYAKTKHFEEGQEILDIIRDMAVDGTGLTELNIVIIKHILDHMGIVRDVAVATRDLLDCGSLDISILDDVGYDLGDIAVELQEEGVKVTLNNIIDAIFRKGQDELKDALEEKISELEGERDECEEGSDEYEELQEQIDELECCDPEEDVEWFCNCLDTSIWFRDNEEIYRKYLEDEISDIEENMGFEF